MQCNAHTQHALTYKRKVYITYFVCVVVVAVDTMKTLLENSIQKIYYEYNEIHDISTKFPTTAYN